MSDEKSSNPEFIVGHEQIRQHWEWAKKQCPDNPKVGLKKVSKAKASYIDFQFKLGAKRTTKTSGEYFTISGINKAIDKAKLISQKLATCQFDTDFWEWYDETVLEKSKVQNDLMTLGMLPLPRVRKL